MESLQKRYANKILNIEELLIRVGEFPRKSKVVMCHGAFDVVHPGHLRHLLFAKTKGEILVASVTADDHIQKGELRPHVPQNLRAANLAAYEMVDYVTIDPNATPLQNLNRLKPDVYIKGFEYAAGSMSAKTQEEYDLISAYGGEMIFSPGDFTLSSSKLISVSPPDIGHDKLITLMQQHNLDFSDLRKTLESIKGLSVSVLGDTIIDSYTRCSMIGGQTKTPTISVLHERVDHYVGGAGIVAKHLAAAGAKVDLLTLLGDDDLGRFAINDLRAAGVVVHAEIDSTRPTTDKNAIVVDNYRLIKVDRLENRPIGEKTIERFADRLSSADADVFVFSDFRHGLFHKGSISRFASAIPIGRFKVADSQVASRWGNITDFAEFELITPNEREARFALGDQDLPLRPLGTKLFHAARCRVLLLKLGERGLLTYTSLGDTQSEYFFHLDSMSRNVVDAVGAGDALLAYASLTLKVTDSPVQAAILGSLAAAHECEVDGNVPVSNRDLFVRLDQLEREVNFTP